MYFVIQVISGKESSIIDILNRKLSKDLFFECFFPQRMRMKKFNGGWKKVIERYFPGYIFIDTDNPKRLYSELRTIGEFTKLLGKQDNENFLPLSEEESRIIDSLMGKETNRITDISYIDINENDEVQVIEGPLLGFEGKIKKINLHKRTATILLDMCGREVETILGIEFIEKRKTCQ